MRKAIPLLLMLLPFVSIAQDDMKTEAPMTYKKNAFKVNFSSLALNNYHFQYERSVSEKIGINIGYRFMPESKLPFQSLLEETAGLDDPNLRLGDFRIKGSAITADVRFYMGKKPMSGFYLAPYFRYSSFDMKLPFTYDVPNGLGGTTPRNADFFGEVSGVSGGLLLGTQFNLGKSLVLDIWWLGGHFGSSNGDLNFISATPLTTQEQNSLRNTLEDFDPSPFKTKNTVTASGARIESDGPWAGLRALGINLGFKF